MILGLAVGKASSFLVGTGSVFGALEMLLQAHQLKFGLTCFWPSFRVIQSSVHCQLQAHQEVQCQEHFLATSEKTRNDSMYTEVYVESPKSNHCIGLDQTGQDTGHVT